MTGRVAAVRISVGNCQPFPSMPPALVDALGRSVSSPHLPQAPGKLWDLLGSGSSVNPLFSPTLRSATKDKNDGLAFPTSSVLQDTYPRSDQDGSGVPAGIKDEHGPRATSLQHPESAALPPPASPCPSSFLGECDSLTWHKEGFSGCLDP